MIKHWILSINVKVFQHFIPHGHQEGRDVHYFLVEVDQVFFNSLNCRKCNRVMFSSIRCKPTLLISGWLRCRTSHCAAALGYTDILYSLEERGANLWIKSLKDEYPLHETLNNQHTGMYNIIIPIYVIPPIRTCWVFIIFPQCKMLNWNSQKYSFHIYNMLASTEYAWEFRNNALWDTLLHASNYWYCKFSTLTTECHHFHTHISYK